MLLSVPMAAANFLLGVLFSVICICEETVRVSAERFADTRRLGRDDVIQRSLTWMFTVLVDMLSLPTLAELLRVSTMRSRPRR